MGFPCNYLIFLLLAGSSFSLKIYLFLDFYINIYPESKNSRYNENILILQQSIKDGLLSIFISSKFCRKRRALCLTTSGTYESLPLQILIEKYGLRIITDRNCMRLISLAVRRNLVEKSTFSRQSNSVDVLQVKGKRIPGGNPKWGDHFFRNVTNMSVNNTGGV